MERFQYKWKRVEIGSIVGLAGGVTSTIRGLLIERRVIDDGLYTAETVRERSFVERGTH